MTNSIKSSRIYQEFSVAEREQYFKVTARKTIHTLDNVYYSVFIKGDEKNNPHEGLNTLIERLLDMKEEVLTLSDKKTPHPFNGNLYYHLKSYSSYGLSVGDPDLYDIFFTRNLPNSDTPRIIVQIRSHGLWTRGIEAMIDVSYNAVKDLLAQYGLEIALCRESRIDYCYHTNAVGSVSVFLKKDDRNKIRGMYTSLTDVIFHAEVEDEDGGTIINEDYFKVGSRKSNSVSVRVYDKVKEVLENSYKSYFFDIWYRQGLISFYDKFCMEYVFTLPCRRQDKMAYLNKASVAFYVQYGKCEETKAKYQQLLLNPNATLKDFKAAAKILPRVTPVLNVEYETKRKYYYTSQSFVGDTLTLPEAYKSKPVQLHNLYKIILNSKVWTSMLTHNFLAFFKTQKDDRGNIVYSLDSDGERIPTDYWSRIRNTKLLGLDGFGDNTKLLRSYTHNLDHVAIQAKAIRAIATSSVLNDNLKKSFVEDISDLLADLNDNDKVGLIPCVYLLDVEGKRYDTVRSELLADYHVYKEKKDRYLRNRKKKRNANAAVTSNVMASLPIGTVEAVAAAETVETTVDLPEVTFEFYEVDELGVVDVVDSTLQPVSWGDIGTIGTSTA